MCATLLACIQDGAAGLSSALVEMAASPRCLGLVSVSTDHQGILERAVAAAAESINYPRLTAGGEVVGRDEEDRGGRRCRGGQT